MSALEMVFMEAGASMPPSTNTAGAEEDGVGRPGFEEWLDRLGESPAPTRRAGEGVGQPLSHLADRRGSVPSASLLAMPVARHAAAAAEYDGVVREFRLLGSASSAVGSVAWRLLELIDRLGGSFAAFSGWHRVELRTAAAAGIEVLDLSIDLAPTSSPPAVSSTPPSTRPMRTARVASISSRCGRAPRPSPTGSGSSPNSSARPTVATRCRGPRAAGRSTSRRTASRLRANEAHRLEA